MDLSNVKVPTAVVSLEKVKNNIRMMVGKSAASEVILRPHFKTHQSVAIGNLFKSEGVSRITVSSVEMASYFARNGWEDITIAFPFNPREYDQIAVLQERCKLSLTVPGIRSAEILTSICRQPTNIFLKIDAGYNRSGLRWDDSESIKKCISILGRSGHITISGLLAHSGNAYQARGREEVTAIYNESVSRINHVRDTIGDEDMILSIGDTPSTSMVEKFEDVDEIRPGNFVFYDLMQEQIGSCRAQDIAMAMACPVVDIRPSNGTKVIYGGAVHLSKEFIMVGGQRVYGRIVRFNGSDWQPLSRDIYITSLSQEHGIISDPDNILDEFDIGDLVGVLPVHSCLAADLAGGYLLSDGRAADHMRGI